MKHFKLVLSLLLVCALLCACTNAPAAPSQSPEQSAPAASPQATPNAAPAASPAQATSDPAPVGEPEEYPGQNVIRGMYGDMDERAQENAPKITTLANGVQVQRTPDEQYAGVYHNPGSQISYNTFYLDADNRGCAACHTDMNALLNNMTYLHVDLSNSFGIQTTVQQCLDCHSYSPGYVTEAYGFGTLIHGLHDKRNEAFQSMSGNCWSCHNATGDGEDMELWDVVKHDVLRGIVDIADVSGEFKVDQAKTTKADDLFFFNWMYYDNDYPRYAAEYADVPLDPTIFDAWELTVKGHVNNPFTAKLTDLIAEGLSVTTTMTMHCTINPSGGPLIGNCEITGIPLKTLLERAGVKPGATVLLPIATDGFYIPIMMDHLDQNEAYVVYEIDGKRLSYAHGYPAQLWLGSGSAAEYVKQISTFEVVNDAKENYYMYLGWELEDGAGYTNKPNVGIFDVQEGQIVPLGKPFTFSGYADAFDQKVERLEISMDRGQTWTPFEMGADLNDDIWINWHYTFTPEEPGAYVFKIRAVTDKGLISNTAAEVMINAK